MKRRVKQHIMQAKTLHKLLFHFFIYHFKNLLWKKYYLSLTVLI